MSQERQISANASSGFWRSALWIVGIGVVVLGLGFAARQVWFAPKSLVILSVAAGPKGSDSYRLMHEVSEVVKRHSDMMRLQVLDSTNSSDTMALINRGGADFATVRDFTPAGENVRLVARLFPDYFYLIARADSGVRRVEDLAHARIVTPDFGAEAYMAFWQVADHYDLPPSALNWRATDFDTASRRLIKGETDVIFNISSLRNPDLLNLVYLSGLQNVPLRFVPIDQAAAMRIKRPLLHAGTIVRGGVDGQVRLPNVDVPSVTAERLLVARADVNSALTEELTRILFEYRLDLVLRLPLAAQIAEPDRSEGFRIPLHEGASWYYERDKPGFFEQNAELLSFYLASAAVLWSAFMALRSRFDARRKNRADDYNQRLLALAAEARDATGADMLGKIKQRHSAILEDIVVALDTDQVTAEGFQSFALLWESVGQTIADQRAGFAGSIS